MSRMEGEALRNLAEAALRAGPDAPGRVVSSEALLSGARVLGIAHAGEIYTLRLTRQNKLLLTK